MSQLRIVDSGILFINDNPAYQHVAAFFPNIVQTAEEDFVCVYQRGDGMYAANSHRARLRSHDGGKTWVDEGPLFDQSEEERPYSYHGSTVSRMHDGLLVVIGMRIDRSNPHQELFGEAGGLVACETVLSTSRDDGRTWSEPQVMTLPIDQVVVTPAQSIIELADGRWYATFDVWPTFDDPGPYKPRMIGFFSNDEGRTWTDMAVMADGLAERRGYWHGRAIRLADDRLFSLFWSADMTHPDQGPIDLPIHYSFGDPTGRQWETPQPTALPGQTNCTTQLPDGRLAAVYTAREAEQPGFWVVLSDKDGRKWDVAHQLRVWDAAGWTKLGISSPDRYPRSHDTIAFGAPSIITTTSGELLASWWCTYASLTHLRWAKIAANPASG